MSGRKRQDSQEGFLNITSDQLQLKRRQRKIRESCIRYIGEFQLAADP
ncbi:hypothetical protein [Stieleria varia]|nr:hypothetical protein [Stieleria varia]